MKLLLQKFLQKIRDLVAHLAWRVIERGSDIFRAGISSVQCESGWLFRRYSVGGVKATNDHQNAESQHSSFTNNPPHRHPAKRNSLHLLKPDLLTTICQWNVRMTRYFLLVFI